MSSIRRLCKKTCDECSALVSDRFEEDSRTPTWSAWSKSSECSQTCGQGVRTFKRRCKGGMTSDCKGNSKKTEVRVLILLVYFINTYF